MSIFAVHYTYSQDEDLIAAIRPEHRVFLGQLATDGVLLASGPMVDWPGALLIFEAGSAQELASLLDQDPFDIAGAITERVIDAWNPILGSWVTK